MFLRDNWYVAAFSSEIGSTPVARRICDVLARGSGEVTPGFPESLLMRINAMAPGLASRALAGSDRKARQLLSTTMRSPAE